jgi:hypothetical protein
MYRRLCGIMNRELTIPQNRWLFSAHLLFVATWLGSSVCWLVLLGAAQTTTDPGTLRGAYEFLHVIDLDVVVPSAFGVLITGIAQGILTQWGLFRFRWVVAKEVATILVMLFGAIPVGSWEAANLAIVRAPGFGASPSPEFLQNQVWLLTGNAFVVAIMVAIVFVSVFKPGAQVRRA